MGASGGMQTSDPVTKSPFGNLPFRMAQGVVGRYTDPLSMAFGLGGGQHYADLMRQISSGQAQGPTAQFIQASQGVLPNLVPQAQQLAGQITQQGNQAFGGFENQINSFLAQLPNFQALLGQSGTGYQQAMTTGQGMTQQGQDVLNAGLARANATTPENAGLPYARRQAEQAFSPIANQALYQNAVRGMTDATRAGAAARGTLDSGGAQATEEQQARDLAAQFAQQQFANQQAATQGLGGLDAQSMATQLASQGLGLQQAGLGAGLQGTGLEALLSGASGLGQVAQGQAGLAGAGVDAASALFQAIPQLAQLLQGAQAMPLNALNAQGSFIAGQQSPLMSLLAQVAPVVGNSSKGFQQSAGITG